MDPTAGGEWSAEDAAQAVRAAFGEQRFDTMLVLGSGLAEAARPAQSWAEIEYSRIPGMAPPRAAGHPGKLVAAAWGKRRVLVFQGRLHFHEGKSWTQVTLPVRLATQLGASVGLFTNMSGSVHSRLPAGSMMVIDDHLNFMGTNPLVGVTANDPAQMFPDMGEAYSPRLRDLLDEAAAIQGLRLAHGVYAAVSGPNYETPAEVRALALLGADAVGMSTVGEVLVARQRGMECCAISCVANLGAGVGTGPIRHADVLAAAQSMQVRLASLLDAFFHLL